MSECEAKGEHNAMVRSRTTRAPFVLGEEKYTPLHKTQDPFKNTTQSMTEFATGGSLLYFYFHSSIESLHAAIKLNSKYLQFV